MSRHLHAIVFAMLATVCSRPLLAGKTTNPPSSAVIIETSALNSEGLNGSKYRHGGFFNHALANALTLCGQADLASKIRTSARFNSNTANAIRTLRTCSGWQISGETGSGDITEGLWRKLLPVVPIPSQFERAFIIILTLENTDYDALEWNYGSKDDSFATWGPFGATIAGNEIQEIMGAVDNAHPELTAGAFRRAAESIVRPSAGWPIVTSRVCATPANGPSDDYELFRRVISLRGVKSGEILRTAFCDPRRRAIWTKAFQFLGGDAEIRRAFDKVYLTSIDGKAPKYLQRTKEAYAKAGLVPTSIDLAMGLDGPTQLTSRANVIKVAAALVAAGRNISPARARFEISEKLPTPGAFFRANRCARDAVFFISDAASLPTSKVCAGNNPPHQSTPRPCLKKDRPDWTLREAWRYRHPFTAQNVGLLDIAAPDFRVQWTYDFDSDGH